MGLNGLNERDAEKEDKDRDIRTDFHMHILSHKYDTIGGVMLSPSQIFVVVDIETDGPAVGMHSMLSLAAVATDAEKQIGQFYRKLSPLENAKQDPETMLFWSKNPEAWKEVTTDAQPIQTVMTDFCTWVTHLGKEEPIFVSSPIGLDYTFVSWYLYRFAPTNPFISNKNALRTLDIRSYIAGLYGFSYDNSSRLKWPAKLMEGMPEHTHDALEDAVGYAFLLGKMVSEHKT